MGNVIAEGGNGTVVVGPAPFTEEVREAIDQNLGPRLLTIQKHQLLPCLLTLAILRCAKAASQCGLNGRADHDGTGILVLLQRVQQRRSEAEVALHELLVVLRTVHTCEIEHEVAVRAVGVQLLRRTVQVVAVQIVDVDAGASSVLAVPDVLQIVDEGSSDHALCAGNQDVHLRSASHAASASRT